VSPRTVHLVVPEGIDDPEHPSGGNGYDRRLRHELTVLGWEVRVHVVPGRSPVPTPAVVAALGCILERVPAGSIVLVDGLVASGAPEAVIPHTGRLRVVVLVHMPVSSALPGRRVRSRERAVLSSVAAVVTPSDWARRWVVHLHGLPPARVHVAEPGVDVAALSRGTPGGGELVCVAAVVPAKGQDTLLEALASLRHLPWRCRCVGALDLEPRFVKELRARVHDSGLDGRFLLTGPFPERRLRSALAQADLLVSASRLESYGMAVTEALARGLPVVAGEVGGIPEAVGTAPDGTRPGLLVPAGDPQALAAGIERWLLDADLRGRLRRAAAARRTSLTSWQRTARLVARALEGEPAPGEPIGSPGRVSPRADPSEDRERPWTR
jgi:glycosyltransferase involved in cell wall biosynthesis